MQQEEPLLLGLIDSKISEDISWTENKIGGLPAWLHPSPSPCCKLCAGQMSLVCQLYCPLGGSSYHRLLYVFACTKKQCWNKHDSWTVLRSQLEDTSYVTSLSTSNQNGDQRSQIGGNTAYSGIVNSGGAPSDEWGADSDCWGMDNDDWGDDGGDASTDTIAMVTAQFEDVTLQSRKLSGQNIAELPAYIDVAKNGDLKMCKEVTTRESNSEVEIDEGLDSAKIDLNDMNGIIIPEDRLSGDNKEGILFLQSEQKNEKDGSLEEMKTDIKACADVLTVTFEPHYINVFEEPESTLPSFKHEQHLLKEYSRREGVNITDLVDDRSSVLSKGAEKYEKTEVKHGDIIFHKFQKRVANCPQQILRYQYNGSPLYISASESLPCIPVCEYCGAKRAFELQLMPSLVPFMRMHNNSGVCLEFGAVYIYTCANSCWRESHTVQREHVCVQPDPDSRFFKT